MPTRHATLALTLAAAALLATHPTHAAGTGTWTSTNDPAEAREETAGATLPDGRILIAGGEGYQGVLTLTELFDPTTNTYTTVAPLGTPRDQATATTLTNGQVLVVGGTANNTLATPLATAELYNPATNTWTPTGSMRQPRFGHQAALLHDGRVLIMGGTPDVSTQLRTCELYNPATGRFSPTGAMRAARRYSNAVTLPDARVLEAGDSAGAELYTPATGTWADTKPAPLAIFAMPLALLPDGTVLAAPSQAAGTAARGQTFNPATNAWTTTGATTARYYPAVIPLTDGSVLIAGGCTANCSHPSVTSTVRYIPARRAFVAAAPTIQGHQSPQSAPLPHARALIQGGFAPQGAATAETFTP